MKFFIGILSLFAFFTSAFAASQIILVDEKNLNGPESVVHYSFNDTLFISNTAGGPAEKDGKGWITRTKRGGDIKDQTWIKGLHSPKGMAIDYGAPGDSRDDKLLVADIDTLHIISLKNRQREAFKFPIQKGEFLNECKS